MEDFDGDETLTMTSDGGSNPKYTGTYNDYISAYARARNDGSVTNAATQAEFFGKKS